MVPVKVLVSAVVVVIVLRDIIPQGGADEVDAMSTSLTITSIQTDTMSTSQDQAESDSASS